MTCRLHGGALAVLLLASTAFGRQVAHPPSRLPDQDRLRLAEVRRLASAIQDSVWPGWSSAPFAVLLVTDSLEFLVWHPRPSADFQAQGYDSLLAADVLARPRRHPPHSLATFPAVGGVPTIVVGQPANTGKNSRPQAPGPFHFWDAPIPQANARGLGADRKTFSYN